MEPEPGNACLRESHRGVGGDLGARLSMALEIRRSKTIYIPGLRDLREGYRESAMRTFAMALALSMAGMATAESRVPADLAEIQLSFAPVVRDVAPSVVNIYAKRIVESRFSPFADDPFFSQFFNMRARPRQQNSLGSGVILGDNGIVVTNFHVVGNATDIRVVLADRREFDAEVLLSDERTDLAVLRLADPPALPALGFADSDAVQVGDLVLAIGNPFGVGQTVSSGIISAGVRTGNVNGKPGHFIQTDAPINPGNSGGALVDMKGRLVGINTAIVTRSGGSNGIGLAIPANLVRQYVSQAMSGNRKFAYPWSGVKVQAIDGSLANALRMAIPQGALIVELHPKSPFAHAGLEVGDVITTIKGQPVDGHPEMRFRMMALGTDDSAEVTFLRNSVKRTANIELSPAPESPPRNPLTIENRGALDGLTAINSNPAVISELSLPLDTEGVVVARVEGQAARTGLRPGDVLGRINGTIVSDTDDLRRIAVRRARGYEIEFRRGGKRGVVRFDDR